MRSSRKDRYNLIFPCFLIAVCGAMLLFDIFCVDHFIGYIDGEAYYSYLPEYFLEGNWEHFEKYPIGTAVCELPFFLIAHGITVITNVAEADGYTIVYDWAVGLSGIFYFALGSGFLYVVLRKMLNGKWAFWSIFLLTAGTALPLYATKYASFSHIKTYALTAIFMYVMLRILEDRDRFSWHLLAGILTGLIVILRNTNIFILLFYFLYELGDKEKYKAHIRKAFSPGRLFPDILGMMIIVGPQLILWKIATGSFFCYSYEGEEFLYLANPKISEVFFSDAKGLLIFSPVLFFSILGIFFLWKGSCRKYAAGVTTVFAAETYITSAWWCWWLGGVYSIRSYIDIFPFLALSTGVFFSWLEEAMPRQRSARIGLKLFYGIVTAGFCLMNFAFMKGTLSGLVNETMAFWWELREALRTVLVF